MDVIPRDRPSDELRAAIQAAQADLAQACQTPQMRKDPLRLILAALSAVLGVFGKSITRWESAVADVIAARDPFAEEDKAALTAELVKAVEDGAYRGMRNEAARMSRTLDRRLSVRIGLAVSGAYVLGALSALGFLAVTYPGSPMVAGISAGPENCKHNLDGSVICWIPVWKVPPPVAHH